MADRERRVLGDPGDRRALTPLPWWAAALGVLAVVAASTGAYFLLGAASEGVASPDTAATLRVEVLRTALSVGAGTGAAVALLLAWRRQWLLEHVAHDTSYDAAEKRVTELYVKAVEQLGSEKAPVRMGGLYALERLAQDNPPQRQMIVEVICAYLRMPFDPDDPGGYRHEERHVRITAHKLLCRHLTPLESGEPNPRYWGALELDLVGAVLEDFRLEHATVGRADFAHARFIGTAGFWHTRFTGGASFEHASIGRARFGGAVFSGPARFDGASFSEADFAAARFEHDVHLDAADVPERTSFEGVRVENLTGASRFAMLPSGWEIVAAEDDPSIGRAVREGEFTAPPSPKAA